MVTAFCHSRIFSSAFFHPHLVIRVLSSAFCHSHFAIRFLSSAFYHPHFVIRILPSAFYHPHFNSRIRHPPPSGPQFTETWKACENCLPLLKHSSSTISFTGVAHFMKNCDKKRLTGISVYSLLAYGWRAGNLN